MIDLAGEIFQVVNCDNLTMILFGKCPGEKSLHGMAMNAERFLDDVGFVHDNVPLTISSPICFPQAR